MEFFRRVSEGLARRSSRRGLFGRSAEIATGALLGAAAGTLTRPGGVSAGHGTVCAFPGPGCPCDGCMDTGACAKPCVMNTTWYVSGCWVSGGVTCCDCQCHGMINDIFPNHNRQLGDPITVCGCGSDFHNDPANCP